MISPELVAALRHVRRGLPRAAWMKLAGEFAAAPAQPVAESLREPIANLHNRDAAWLLSEAIERTPDANGPEIAAAMTAVDCLLGDELPVTEIIWTGPANHRFPVRRIDQVLYDLVSKAKTRIVLVTFAAHRGRHLCEHLIRAVERGVALTLIVESENESEGQLTRDAVEAFWNISPLKIQLYYWPLSKRERNQAGRPGKLHMKCAIVDDVAPIGSANLTDDAFNRNMELGILVREQPTVEAIAGHFRELISTGALVSVSTK